MYPLQNLEVLVLHGSNVSGYYYHGDVIALNTLPVYMIIVMLATVLLYSMLLQTEGLQGTKYKYRDN